MLKSSLISHDHQQSSPLLKSFKTYTDLEGASPDNLVKIIFELLAKADDLKANEEDIENSYFLQNAISAILQISLGDQDLENKLKQSLEMIISTPWFDLLLRGGVFLLDKGTDDWGLSINYNLGLEDIDKKVHAFTKSNSWLSTVDSCQISHFNYKESDFDILKTPGLECGHYLIPLISNNQSIGMILLFSVKDHIFSNEAEDFFAIISNILSGTIERDMTQQILTNYRDHLEDLVKKRTDELMILNTNLVEAVKNAEQANKLKGDFLANMSHEIRTPINGILGMTTLFKRDNLTSEQIDQLEIIKISTNSLLNLVNDILDFSKIEAGLLELESIPFNIKNLLSDKLKMFKPMLNDKDINLFSFVSDDVPEYVKGDPARIQQIIINLISNAIKFTHEGGIEVNCTVKKDLQKHLLLQFEVKDSGIGIPKGKTGIIFDSFRQADGSHTRKYGGTGLGLSICKQLVGLMHGKIWVKSKVDVGSSFFFNIKLDKLTDAELTAQKIDDVSKTINIEDFKTLKVLLAEDFAINQKVFKGMLEMFGHQTVIANDGVEALSLYQNENFDLVFMDIQMPNMDGVESTIRIREYENKSGKRTPIIALTAHAMKGDREKYISKGMDDYLSKPINSENLEKLLYKYMSSAKGLGVVQLKQPVDSGSIAKTDAVISSINIDSLNTTNAPIDMAQAIKEFRGNADLVYELLAESVVTFQNQATEIEKALERSDFEFIRSNAHSIKGGAANMIINDLSAAAKNLEFAAKEGNIEKCALYTKDLRFESDRLATYFQEEVKK
ncbi:MAG: hypothetical protein A2Y40_07860 [Candidatus Margulisbacteria bacterium GWF2_35_9]|nr:MAG: hypothetical protein A2Y40_07860 [Candidatus Margulisbacteria bacterium GWF2_35_9]